MTEPKKTLDDDERAEEMTRAPKASPEDAAPRVELTEGTGGATRIDIADTAVVRPGSSGSSSSGSSSAKSGEDAAEH